MESLLSQFGLDPTEAKVYSALLTLGSATVTEVTSTAGITRTLGYSVLEKLESYELVKSVSRETSKKKLYVAESPEKIISFVEDQKTVWERKLAAAKRHLPSLLSLYKIGDRPVLRYEEGIEKIKNVSRETFEEGMMTKYLVNIPKQDDGLEEVISHCYGGDASQSKTIAIDKALPWVAGAQRVVEEKKVPSLLDLNGVIAAQEDRLLVIVPTEFDYAAIVLEGKIFSSMFEALHSLAWEVSTVT